MPRTSTPPPSPTMSSTGTYLSPDVGSPRTTSPAPTELLSGTRAFWPGSTTRQTSETGTIAASTKAPTSLARRHDEFVLKLTQVESPGIFKRNRIKAEWLVGSKGFSSHKPSLDPTLDLEEMCALGNDIGRQFTEYTNEIFLRTPTSETTVSGRRLSRAVPSGSKEQKPKMTKRERAVDLVLEDFGDDPRAPPNAKVALWTEMDRLTGPQPIPNSSLFRDGAWKVAEEREAFHFTPLVDCERGSYPQV